MAGKVKFDQEAAFNSIIGTGRQQEDGAETEKKAAGARNKNRVQRAYFLDRDIDKALRRKALEEEKNLTETINEALRQALDKYL